MSLERYREKRDFNRTREPGPEADGLPPAKSLRFVVQKHAARRLHYDFRLEWDGVLQSWAVPKGPSLDPREKRLAVHVEAHPLEYARFEGVIADGNYGAGEVIVWDAGIYSPDGHGRLSFGNRDEAEARMREDLERGKLSFTLRGRKLRGSWTLVKTKRATGEWLLIKHQDRFAEAEREVLAEERSVQSGRTLEELKNGRLPEPGEAVDADALLARGRAAPFPTTLEPMLARVADRPFTHPDWLFEPKLDGFRIVAFVEQGRVRLRSRGGLDYTEPFAAVAADLAEQPGEEMVLDGEVVALDERGLPDFGLLQRYAKAEERLADPLTAATPLVYYPFDLLYLDGVDLTRLPLVARKAVLQQALAPTGHVRPVEYVEGDGTSFLRAVSELGLEGMVAKMRDGRYEPGRRSSSWLKVKVQTEEEFVVCGYTQGGGARAESFGALLLATHDGPHLRYAGRVGTGFDQRTLVGLAHALGELAADACPLTEQPHLEGAVARWVRPELTARVRFAERTEDGLLRAPVFVALRRHGDAPPAVDSARGLPPQPPGLPDATLEDDVALVLRQLETAQEKLLLQVGPHRVPLTNLHKELWPPADGAPAVTKGDLLRYYARVSPFLLPHLRDRPMTLTRYPNGIAGESFYQKHWEPKPPPFVETVRIFSSHNDGDGDYILVNNLPTLLWLAQLANIELHPWTSRTERSPDALAHGDTFTGSRSALDASVLSYPDWIVFDLDPYIYAGREHAGEEPALNRRAFGKVVEMARVLKEVLDQLALSSFLKTSGKTGLHIYVPVLRQYDYAVTRRTCEVISRFLLERCPQDVTMEWAVAKRTGRVFLDHNQNTRGKNMAAIYSLRPAPGAPVSMPVRWDELDGVYPTDFTIRTVPERLARLGDLWAGILEAKHELRRLLESS